MKADRVFAVLQTHASVEQLDLVRLGASVLWRIHHARAPPTQLLHSQVMCMACSNMHPMHAYTCACS